MKAADTKRFSVVERFDKSQCMDYLSAETGPFYFISPSPLPPPPSPRLVDETFTGGRLRDVLKGSILEERFF